MESTVNFLNKSHYSSYQNTGFSKCYDFRIMTNNESANSFRWSNAYCFTSINTVSSGILNVRPKYFIKCDIFFLNTTRTYRMYNLLSGSYNTENRWHTKNLVIPTKVPNGKTCRLLSKMQFFIIITLPHHHGYIWHKKSHTLKLIRQMVNTKNNNEKAS